MSLKIIGLGKGIPESCVSNDDLVSFLDTSDEWIVSRTGIKSRHVCTSEKLTDLSTAAALQALNKAGLSPKELDLIICTTIGGDYRTPSLACCVLERIGARCPAFDMNAACTGFIYALNVASAFLGAGSLVCGLGGETTGSLAGRQTSNYKNILIVCAEIMSTQMDWSDRNTCVLFGDGAAACVVTKGDMLKYIHLSAEADTSILNLPSGTGNSPFATERDESCFLNMQGREVFKFAVNAVEDEIEQALESLELQAKQIDWYILHQANKRIIDFIRMKLGQPEGKFPINIDRYGNLSSASVPLLLYEMLEDGLVKSGDVIFMSAFGAGMTAGSCVIVWE